MAEEEPTDLFPAFWSLSTSNFGSGSRSRSETDNDGEHHQDPTALSLRHFNSSSPSPSIDLDLGFQDWVGDEFLISGRRRTSEFEYESNTDEEIVAIREIPIPNPIEIQLLEEMSGPRFDFNNPPLCWDCLQIDENRRELNEEFEWEEIDDDGDAIITINANQEDVLDQEEEADIARNLEWEVLLTMDDLDAADPDSYFDEGFIYATSDYDVVLFDQHDSLPKGGPPASKSAVESLPSFVVTTNNDQEESNRISCAVCKDEVGVGEKGKRLPCSHCYHEECILPWLGLRNTCPLCRYELPTDNAEYENRKARRAYNQV